MRDPDRSLESSRSNSHRLQSLANVCKLREDEGICEMLMISENDEALFAAGGATPLRTDQVVEIENIGVLISPSGLTQVIGYIFEKSVRQWLLTGCPTTL